MSLWTKPWVLGTHAASLCTGPRSRVRGKSPVQSSKDDYGAKPFLGIPVQAALGPYGSHPLGPLILRPRPVHYNAAKPLGPKGPPPALDGPVLRPWPGYRTVAL